MLLELFPEARFVYMVRSPDAVIPSTIRLWRTLYEMQGLQRPNFAELENSVFDTMNLFHERIEHTRQLIPAEQFCRVRFEDLTGDTLNVMHRVYEQLHLGDFDCVRPAMEAYLSSLKDYKGNRWDLPDTLRDRIRDRCAAYQRCHGYES